MFPPIHFAIFAALFAASTFPVDSLKVVNMRKVQMSHHPATMEGEAAKYASQLLDEVDVHHQNKKQTRNFKSMAAIKQEPAIKEEAHYRFSQVYKGIPVWPQQIVVHHYGGRYRSTGKYIEGLDEQLGSVPGDFNDTGAQIALEIMKMTFASEQKYSLNGVSYNSSVEDVKFSQEASERKIFFDDKEELAKFAYLISFTATWQGSIASPNYVVEHGTNRVLRQWESIQFARGLRKPERLGMGPGGNNRTGKYIYGVDREKLLVSRSRRRPRHCVMDTGELVVRDLRGLEADNYSVEFEKHERAHRFRCGKLHDHDETNGAFSPLNDAMAHGQTVVDMFRQWFGESPLGPGIPVEINVHCNYGYIAEIGYSEPTFGNAYYLRKERQLCISDGDYDSYPLTVLDIVAHEIGHGVAAENSNLTLFNEQSRALCESFCDITGIAATFFARDAHDAAGIFNKAFYVLATTPRWDVQKAYRIFHKANKDFWAPDTELVEGACDVVNAAESLEFDPVPVVEAFRLVGLDYFDGNCTFWDEVDETVMETTFPAPSTTVSVVEVETPTENATVFCSILEKYGLSAKSQKDIIDMLLYIFGLD